MVSFISQIFVIISCWPNYPPAAKGLKILQKFLNDFQYGEFMMVSHQSIICIHFDFRKLSCHKKICNTIHSEITILQVQCHGRKESGNQLVNFFTVTLVSLINAVSGQRKSYKEKYGSEHLHTSLETPYKITGRIVLPELQRVSSQ